MSTLVTELPTRAPETIQISGERLFRLSVDQYHEMLDAGVLWHGAPVELLEGLLVEKRDGHLRDGDVVIEECHAPAFSLRLGDYDVMRAAGVLSDEAPVEFVAGLLMKIMVRKPPHDTAIGLLGDALAALIPLEWCIRAQMALRLSDGEPEPDLAVVRGSRRDFSGRHPEGGECGLVIEVADSTVDTDRTLKQRSYARHSIPTYWIINLRDMRIEVYTDPSGLVAHPEYRRRLDYAPGEFVSLVLDGAQVASIPVDDVLP